jgi:hypothetical protein
MIAELYIIEYRLHGQPKTFIIRSQRMDSTEAWQWASCDAGLVPVPRPGRPPIKRFSKPMAERFGVTEVQWRKSAALAWEERDDE